MVKSTPINLEETFPHFRVKMSLDHVPGHARDPWNFELLCRNGVIYPHGGTKLQAYCIRPLIRKRLEALPCVEVWQRGVFETTVVFDIADFDVVAEVMVPRRKQTPRGAVLSRIRKQKGGSGTPESPIGGQEGGKPAW